MLIKLSKQCEKTVAALSNDVYDRFWKQAHFLANNLRHPSLHAKKYSETEDLWQARINDDWRFYFMIIDDVYFVTAITKHPK